MRTRVTPFFSALGAGFQLGQHAAADRGLLPPCRRMAFTSSQRMTEPSASFTPATSVRYTSASRTASHRAGRSHLVGVHVVVFAVEAKRQAGDDRNDARAPQALDPLRSRPSRSRRHSRGRAASSSPRGTCADRRRICRWTGCPASPIAATSCLLSWPAEHHHGHIAGLRVGNAQSVDEGRLAAQLLQASGSAPRRRRARSPACVLRGTDREWSWRTCSTSSLVVERGPANFHDELHCNPSFSSKPNIRFMFCTACPAAPFRRLSRHETSTARCAIGREREADVAVIGVQREFDLRQPRSAEDPHPGLACVELAQRLLQFFGGRRFRQLHVDGGQDSARNRQQMRRELQRTAVEPELLQHLAGVPMAKNVVGARSRRQPPQNVSWAIGCFPAPETPDFESQMIPCSTSTKPARIHGASARMMDVE